jgi:carboxyl-terminal processing protease
MWGLGRTPVRSQTDPPVPAVAEGEVDDFIARGMELEEKRRWAEALSVYEDAARIFPNHQALQARMQLARVHYDLTRRYADPSFRESVDNIPERDALGLYSQVLAKIQTHHVDSPNWRRLVERGTFAVDQALEDPSFLTHHLPDCTADRIDGFQRELRVRMASFTVRDPTEAKKAVAWAADLARHHLDLKPAAVIYEYTCGATNSLDEYSSFLTAEQLREVYSQIDGNFVGLGVELRADEGALLIVKVIPGSPAEKAGIVAGDRIVGVDGRTTENLSTDEAANLLQGPEGTTVAVLVLSEGGAERRLRVRRENVDVPSVEETRIVDRTAGVGYFRLTCFQKSTPRDVERALSELADMGMRSLIIDLRDNPGGLLTTAVDVVDAFVSRGTIVTTRGRSASEDFNYSARAPGTWDVPLVVLIDGESASASEIFAGAIRDHHRGTLVGERTYGKGSVQGIFPLDFASSGLRLTTAKFYSPRGIGFSRVGVEPDVFVQQVGRPDADGNIPVASDGDPVLAAGVRIARERLASRP